MALWGFDGREPQVGKNSFVSPLAEVIGDVRVGDKCYIGHGAILRGDYGTIIIGNGSAVEEGAVLHAPPKKECILGAQVTIGHGAVIHGRRIGDLVVIGMGAVVSLYAEVGTGSIIGEGGVVKMKQVIDAGVVAVGNPVKQIRRVSEKDKQYWLCVKQIYVDLAQKYLQKGMYRV